MVFSLEQKHSFQLICQWFLFILIQLILGNFFGELFDFFETEMLEKVLQGHTKCLPVADEHSQSGTRLKIVSVQLKETERQRTHPVWALSKHYFLGNSLTIEIIFHYSLLCTNNICNYSLSKLPIPLPIFLSFSFLLWNFWGDKWCNLVKDLWYAMNKIKGPKCQHIELV